VMSTALAGRRFAGFPRPLRRKFREFLRKGQKIFHLEVLSPCRPALEER
jgi:hypothetical protein